MSLAFRLIFFIISLLFIGYIFTEMLYPGGQLTAAGLVGYGFFLLVGLYMFGVSFSALITGKIAGGITDLLLWPRRFLRQAPPELAIPLSMIVRGEYQEAELLLYRMRQKAPASPEIADALIYLHRYKLGDLNSALADSCFFISARRKQWNTLNIKLTFEHLELLELCGKSDEAMDFLKKECHSRIYSAAERDLLAERMKWYMER